MALALAAWQFSAPLAAQDAGREAEALAAKAQQLQALGFRPQAIAELERALGISRAAGERRVLARVLGALGQAQLLAGSLDAARERLAGALEIARAERLDGVAAAALNDLGNLALGKGKDAEALARWGEAAELARRAPAPLVFAAAAANLAQRGQGTGLALEALDALAKVEPSPAAVYRHIELGQALRGARDLERAYRALARALELAERLGEPAALAWALGHLGALYEDERRDAEALELTRRAVFQAQLAGAGEALYRFNWQSARLLARQGRSEEARAAYRRSLVSLAAIRQDLILELRAARRSWREAVGPLFTEYADLLLRANPPGEAGRARLVQARNVIEALKAVELEDYFNDECVARVLAKQKDIDTVAPRTAIVYPVILPDRLEMLVSLPGGMHQVTLPVTHHALAAEALRFRQFLEKRTTNQFMPLARRLYDALIRPLEPLLAAAQADTVVIVPDGPLRQIPFGALHDGERFLAERYAFASAPGLTLIEPQALERPKLQLLVNGLTDAVQNFPALPHVAHELRGIEEVFGKPRTLFNREFSLGSLERELKAIPYSIVHIASHGQFDSDPKKSFLLTYDGRITMDALEQVMKLSRFREEPVELLVLSACRTAAGDERAALGLAGVAVKAGARSALATLWYINDEASSLLVTEFYRRLREPQLSKARALQEAQKAILADPRFRHPGYWSPFLLIGNWL